MSSLFFLRNSLNNSSGTIDFYLGGGLVVNTSGGTTYFQDDIEAGLIRSFAEYGILIIEVGKPT